MRYYTINQVCEELGLSRSRLYQLIGTAFPQPVYLVGNRRPAFTEEQLQLMLEVRRSGIGIDGRAILFYAKRKPSTTKRTPQSRKQQKRKSPSRHSHLVEALEQLGLKNVSESDIERAIDHCRQGDDRLEEAELISRVFRFLKRSKRQN